MMPQQTIVIDTKKWLLIYCLFHLIIWTLTSTIARDTLPHDVAEGIAWGNQWQWGYDKHPPLTAWLVALSAKLGHSISWPVYLFSQVAVVTALWAVWRLASYILPPVLALISVFLLQGIIYYNVQSINITPDTMQTPLWALSMLAFYLALTRKNTHYWLLLGSLTGLAFLAKYQSGVLFISMIAVLLSTQPGRQSFKSAGLYLCAFVFLLVISPHLVWAYQHNFPTLHYAQAAAIAGAPLAFSAHLISPLVLLKCTIGACAAFLAMLIPFMYTQRQKLPHNKFNYQYFWIMGLGPLVFSLIYALISAHNFTARWSTPYFLLFGVLAMIILRPVLTIKNFKAFICLFILVVSLTPMIRFGYLMYWPLITNVAHSDTYIPAHDIATALTEEWHQRFNTPVKYVTGESYLSAYFSIYSSDKPVPFFWGNKEHSDWINEDDVNTQGTIFIWPVIPPNHYVPKDVVSFATLKTHYPQAIVLPIHRFKRLTSAPVPTIDLYIAFIPPQKIDNSAKQALSKS